jgi:hypothetical protein
MDASSLARSVGLRPASASSAAAIAAGSDGSSSTSTPAETAAMAAAPGPPVRAPAMVRASETISPPNPISSRSMRRMGSDRVAGVPEGSSAGNATCAS